MRPLSDRLVQDLTAERTLALRNALAADPDVAFVAALHAMVLQLFYRFASDSCLEISLKSTGFPQVQGLGETIWASEIADRHEGWDRDLPDEERGLWDFLLRLDETSRKSLFAHCIALTLNVVIEPWNRRPRALAHGDAVAGALGFDMVSAGWTAGVDNYLGKVTKARILEAVRQARGEDAAQQIGHLKKPDMAKAAARLLEGSNWLPEPLRSREPPSDADDRGAEQYAGNDEASGRPSALSDEARGSDPMMDRCGIAILGPPRPGGDAGPFLLSRTSVGRRIASWRTWPMSWRAALPRTSRRYAAPISPTAVAPATTGS